MKRTRKRRGVRDAATDELAELLDTLPGGGQTYQPVVGYVFEHGPIVRYAPQTWWYDFGRAVSTCWGSLARRTRGTWDADLHQRGEPIRALLVVVRGDGTVAWKHSVDLREIRETV